MVQAAREVTLAPDLHLPLNLSVLDTFLRFVYERHQIHCRRRDGLPRHEWTTDPVMARNKFANVFRVFDRGSQFIVTDVIPNGPQDRDEVMFRVLLFRCFGRVSTYQLLVEALEGPPTYAGFTVSRYEAILLPHWASGNPIYTNAYYIPTPAEVFQTRHPFQASLRLVSLMMRTGLPERLADSKHMRDAHTLICVYPSIGGFTGMQLLLDLNMTDHVNVSEKEFAACGPGSTSCLVSMFGPFVRGFELQAMLWLQREQHVRFKQLRLDPPRMAASRPAGLSVVDIEHSLCEASKYMRLRDKMGASIRTCGSGATTRSRARAGRPAASGRKPPLYPISSEPVTYVVPPKWESLSPSPSASARASLEKPEAVEEGVFEVSHIVASSGSGRQCLVRWKGFGPEDDTWEELEALRETAGEVVAEYEAWPCLVRDEIARMLAEQEKEGEKLRTASLVCDGSLFPL